MHRQLRQRDVQRILEKNIKRTLKNKQRNIVSNDTIT